VLVDSISHEWYGEGGILNIVDKAKTASGGSQGFGAWKTATPLHNKFLNRLLTWPGHVVVTMRSKSEWVVEKDDRGRNSPKKIGQAPVQRDGVEYEFQLAFDLALEENMVTVSKDRTSIFHGEHFTIDQSTGQLLGDFLRSGKPLEKPEPAEKPMANPEPAEKSEATQQVIDDQVDEALKEPTEEERKAHETKLERQAAGEPEPAASPDPAADEALGINGSPETGTDEPETGTDDGATIKTSEAQVIVKAAKAVGLKPRQLKALVKKVAGVTRSADIPASKLDAILIAIKAEEVPK
jgi:hypothetical protein